MLTANQRAPFAAHGLLKPPAALDPDDARRMCDEVWSFRTATQGISPDDSSTWTSARPAGFGRLSRTGTVDHLWSPTVRSTLSDLLGDEQHRERPRVLMTFPQLDRHWDVPSSAWQFDYTPLQNPPGLRAVQVFALLNDVQPQ